MSFTAVVRPNLKFGASSLTVFFNSRMDWDPDYLQTKPLTATTLYICLELKFPHPLPYGKMHNHLEHWSQYHTFFPFSWWNKNNVENYNVDFGIYWQCNDCRLLHTFTRHDMFMRSPTVHDCFSLSNCHLVLFYLGINDGYLVFLYLANPISFRLFFYCSVTNIDYSFCSLFSQLFCCAFPVFGIF